MRDKPRRKPVTLIVSLLMAAILAGAGAASVPAVERRLTGAPAPLPPALPAHETLLDLRPVAFTMTVSWQKIRTSTTVEQLVSDPLLWRNMHFDDWDALPADLRTRALARMRARFEPYVSGPAVWAALDADAWDHVPQPVGMVVFPLMAEHWVRVYGLAERYDLDFRTLADTLAAILMAESWFDHRAFFENPWGNLDIGLGQCSNRCRRDLAKMADEGLLEFRFEDEDYYNPWHAARAAAVWFGLELERAEGDLQLAIRAYHRGFANASRGEGADYLANVERVRGRYISGEVTSPTWLALRDWARLMALRPRPLRI